MRSLIPFPRLVTRVGRPDCLVDLRLYKYGRPARAIFGKQGGGKYSVFFCLRALAGCLCLLAVLQVCGYLQCVQSSRLELFVAGPCSGGLNCGCGASKCLAARVQVCCRCVLCAVIAGSAGLVSKRSKSNVTVRYCCKAADRKPAVIREVWARKDTSQQTRDAHAAV